MVDSILYAQDLLVTHIISQWEDKMMDDKNPAT